MTRFNGKPPPSLPAAPVELVQRRATASLPRARWSPCSIETRLARGKSQRKSKPPAARREPSRATSPIAKASMPPCRQAIRAARLRFWSTMRASIFSSPSQHGAERVGALDRHQPPWTVTHASRRAAGDGREKYGRVVNIASDAARVGSTGEAVYAACKSAMLGF